MGAIAPESEAGHGRAVGPPTTGSASTRGNYGPDSKAANAPRAAEEGPTRSAITTPFRLRKAGATARAFVVAASHDLATVPSRAAGLAFNAAA